MRITENHSLGKKIQDDRIFLNELLRSGRHFSQQLWVSEINFKNERQVMINKPFVRKKGVCTFYLEFVFAVHKLHTELQSLEFFEYLKI